MRVIDGFSVFLLGAGICLSGCDGSQHSDQPGADTSEQSNDTSQVDSLPVALVDTLHPFLHYDGVQELYGFANQFEQTIIEPQFTLAGNFVNGKAPVVKDEIHGFCDSTGKIYPLQEGIKFRILFDEPGNMWFFEGISEGMVMVEDEFKRYGFVNSENELAVPCIYAFAKPFSEGLAKVWDGEKSGYVDKNGNVVIDLQYAMSESFSEGLAAVLLRDDSLYGFIDVTGKEVIPMRYASTGAFHEGLCWVTIPDAGGFGFIDQKGKLVIKGPFDNVTDFFNGQAAVEKNKKCMYIDYTGKKIQDCSCDIFYAEGC